MRRWFPESTFVFWQNYSRLSHPWIVVERGAIGAASLLVPAARREEWRKEWLAELWHVRECSVGGDEPTWKSEKQVLKFCMGAFPDALCVRECSGKTTAPHAHVHGSAGQCLLWLGTAAAICLVLAQFLPGVQAEQDAQRFQISPEALQLFDKSLSGPGIPYALYRQWKQSPQRYFEDLAFYRVVCEFSTEARARWVVAHASPNFFSVVGLRIGGDSSLTANTQAATLVLSRKAWLRDFGGDPQIAGTIVHLGTRSLRIAGVAPAGAWRMPGEPDVWVLESEPVTSATADDHGSGYLFGRLSERGQMNTFGNAVDIQALDLHGGDLNLAGVTLALPLDSSLSIFSFSAFLALLALPAIISVSLGQDGVSSHRPSVRQRACRFLFLLVKFVLVAVLGYYGSLDCAYSITSTYSPVAECLQLLACFVICLAGFQWAVADQRRRCPVCLRRVTHPAQVGLASCTFLGWNGTEMMCAGGHTLLHVPALPTSWFSGQRWMYLDSSWDFLFSDSFLA